MDRGFTIRGLGEIAIRCNDFAAMAEFYGDVLGLPRLSGNSNPSIVFFRIAEGFGGHTQVLALFDASHDRSAQHPASGHRNALHHIALSLPLAEQDAVLAWYAHLGLSYRVEEFEWTQWRGVFTNDPDGNTVELVAFDPALIPD